MPISENKFIQDFLNYLSFQKRYSENTVVSYQNDLEAFFEFLTELYETNAPEQITTSMVRTWLASLKENQVASRTINRKISTLKSFFKYMVKMGVIGVNPAATIASLKISKRLPSFVEETAVKEMMAPENFDESWGGILQKVILEILYSTGIRRNELLQLKCSDIHFGSGTIKVLGKGNKERIIPAGPRLLNSLTEYLNQRKAFFEQGVEDYLLLTSKGKKLYPKYVYKVVNRRLQMVTTIERKSPHTLRHTFATHLTNHGAQINAIKELLGHSSLAATQIYTHNTIEKLKEVHKSAHPKAKN